MIKSPRASLLVYKFVRQHKLLFLLLIFLFILLVFLIFVFLVLVLAHGVLLFVKFEWVVDKS